MVALLHGCAVLDPKQDYVDVSAWSANYTEEYVKFFAIQARDGEPLGIGGAQVKEISKGGTGINGCCAKIPGVGRTVKVVWEIGESKTLESKDVVITGTPFYIGGDGLEAFSKGGTGGSQCCAAIPGVGKPISVVWTVGDEKSRIQQRCRVNRFDAKGLIAA